MTSTVYIAKNVYGGDGLGRLGDGRVVFVRGAKAGLKVDYVECVDAETLEPKKKIAKGTCVLVAAYDGKTRLIDNMKV